MTDSADPAMPGRPGAGPAQPARRSAMAAAAAGLLGLQQGAGAAVPPLAANLPRLKRGVNLSRWFEYERSMGLAAAELARLRATGLDHVRLPLDPVACGWRPDQPEQLPFLPALLQALADITGAGLVAVLDMHLEPADKALLESEPAYEGPVVTLWATLARALTGLAPEQLVLDLFNEPQYYGLNAWRWPPLQRRLLAAVRAALPSHLVLLSPQGGASQGALANLVPLKEPGLAYTFHCYDPFVLTHQGVPWVDEAFSGAGLVSGLVYPPSLQGSQPVRYARPSARALADVADYGSQRWSAARVAQLMAVASGWARLHGAHVVCTEFGVFRAGVDAASRGRWLRDMRLGLEALGFGWTVWDYTDLFGLTAESGRVGMAGQRTIEPAFTLALGLAAMVPPPVAASGR